MLNKTRLAAATCLTLLFAPCLGGLAQAAPAPHMGVSMQNALPTATPIKHLVIIFGENQSFDHYFGTYPKAANPAGEPAFIARPATPQVNGYLSNPALLTANPNTTNAANLATGIAPSLMNPFRIDRAQFDTAGQNHSYMPEQRASNGGRMDAFVANTGHGSKAGAGSFGTAAQVMGYFDGNTVTALWNYAQHFAMSDNAFTDSFGPSTPGALNVVAGTTNGASNASGNGSVPDGQGGFTMIGDPDPKGDVCTTGKDPVVMAGRNIGDLLNLAGITWGGFMGGFDTSLTNANGTTGCARSTVSPNTSRTVRDYKPHHAWFQYYASTQNPQHTRPSAPEMIGRTEPVLDAAGSTTPVHHQYDYKDFVAAVAAGNFPSVSYLKAPAFQDGHPGNSNPLDEQAFYASTINFLQQQPDWKNTAILVLYDDSDGWYDHQAPTVTTSSADPAFDQLTGPGHCDGPGARPGIGLDGKPVNGRCGPGSRMPFLLISPYAKANFVDSTPITQASVVRFIEDNWLGGQRIGGGSADATAGSILAMFDFKASPRLKPLFLDPQQGTVVARAPA
ncbi:phospholipase C [Novosphingobium rosa]|uniref:phospholipase C n=1 Tax=Novosphingobium rosa TaxID=76978 RepID=UPI000837A7F5|nr:alkaline phosphatase family protein [Novosphingobium rosa]